MLTDEGIGRRTVEVRRAQWLLASDRVTLVAADATRGLIGFASAILLAQPEAGYLHTLYLAPGATGNGLGEVLIRAVAAELQARGIANMALRTLRLNRAFVLREARCTSHRRLRLRRWSLRRCHVRL